MTGNEYKKLIANYLVARYGTRGVDVYLEVRIGKSIIGKGRRIDIFVHEKSKNKAFAIECKYQESAGTVDEKIPYALQDMSALPMLGGIVYAGSGFSSGVLHMLQSSEMAAYCMPDPLDLHQTQNTWELDHLLALHFEWWDILIANKAPHTLSP